MTENLNNELKLCSDYMNSRLSALISNYRNNVFYVQETEELFSSVEYSLLAGGKRIRPYLALSFCRLCGGNPKNAVSFAVALEMIHTYSLIHDDLPCMDNDDMRRGKPANHKVYGEATALLAGDALLTGAFSVISNSECGDREKIDAIRILSENAGILGMIGGQEIDLKSEGKIVSLETLYALQERKTGKLIEAACLLGCIASGDTGSKKLCAARAFAKSFGLAFQITDDILDVTGDEVTLGKSTGSDEKEHKSTFVSHLGLEGAKKEAEKQVSLAKSALKSAFSDSEILTLCELCDYLLTRKS